MMAPAGPETLPLVAVKVGRTEATVTPLIGEAGVGTSIVTGAAGVRKVAVSDQGPTTWPFRAWAKVRTRQWNVSS